MPPLPHGPRSDEEKGLDRGGGRGACPEPRHSLGGRGELLETTLGTLLPFSRSPFRCPSVSVWCSLLSDAIDGGGGERGCAHIRCTVLQQPSSPLVSPPVSFFAWPALPVVLLRRAQLCTRLAPYLSSSWPLRDALFANISNRRGSQTHASRVCSTAILLWPSFLLSPLQSRSFPAFCVCPQRLRAQSTRSFPCEPTRLPAGGRLYRLCRACGVPRGEWQNEHFLDALLRPPPFPRGNGILLLFYPLV